MSSTRSMAAELAPFGIRINALSPGTRETDRVLANPHPPEQQAERTAIQLRPRMAHPGEMVGRALMRTSDARRFITGHVVFVDGGMVPR